MGLKHCLICYQEISCKVIDDGQEINLSRIDKQLNGIFILKELLKLPSNFLVKWLEMCPERNPGSWISLCGECGEMVGEGRGIFEEIVKAQRRFKVLQEKVVRKLKETLVIKNEADGRTLEIGELVTEESRRFASEYDYENFRDPFRAGDLEAYQRLLEIERKKGSEVKSPEMEIFSKEIVDEFVSSPVPSGDDDDTPWSPGDTLQEGHSSQMESENDSDKDVKRYKEHVRKPRKRKISNPSRKRLIEEEDAFVTNDGKLAYRCQIEGCSNVFRRKSDMKNHRLEHSSGKPQFPCDLCKRAFNSHMGLYKHKIKAHKNVPGISLEKSKCPHCDLIITKPNLATHIKVIHEKVYNFYCEICGSGQTCQRDMKWHQTVAHGICSVEGCKLAFAGDRQALRSHQMECHGKEIDVFSCDQCEKLFVRVNHLQRHKRLHEYKKRIQNKEGGGGVGGEEWICDQCGRTFGLREKLVSHIAWHKKNACKEDAMKNKFKQTLQD